MRQPDSWDEVFMALARDIARRSKDPSTQHGAVIVDERNAVVSLGFNGPPRLLDDRAVPWNERVARPSKYDCVKHAESNAIRFGWRARRDFDGCRLYVTGPPCARCALEIVSAEIMTVVHGDVLARCCDEVDQHVAAWLFSSSGVEVRICS